MRDWIQFEPMFNLAGCVGILLLLLVIILWKEAPSLRTNTGLKSLSIFFLMGGVAGLLFQPSIRKESAIKTVLLTKGYNSTTVDSLIRNNKTIRILHTPGTENYKKSLPIRSYHELIFPDNKVQYILGEGVPQHALDLIPDKSFTFVHTPSSADGIFDLEVPKKIYPNNPQVVQGAYFASEAGYLYLDGPGGKEDSIKLNPGKNFFSLRFNPKTSGEFLYAVYSRNSSGYSKKEPVPIHVLAISPLTILFVQQFPTFEVKYLKEFLARHHRVVIRSQLSRGIYRYEYLNIDHRNFDKLSSSTLEKVDLMIIDSDAFLSLSLSEKKSLEEAVRNGLGALFIFNSDPKSIAGLNTYLPLNFKSVNKDTVQIPLSRGKRISLATLPYELDDQSDFTPIIEHKGNVISGYNLLGAGKATYSLLTETFPLILQGDTLHYGMIWTPIVERTSRSERKNFDLKLITPFPYATDEPVRIEIRSADQIPKLLYNGTRIPVKEDFTFDHVWNATIWPDSTGWNYLQIQNDSSTYPFYVSAKDSWQSLRSAQKTFFTKLSSSAGQAQSRRFTYVPLRSVYFFLMFLIGVGYLWLWPKLT